MAYVLGQYNKKRNSENNIFMELITDSSITAKRQINSPDSGVIWEGANLKFLDECLYYPSNFSASKIYYFHGKIQRMNSAQTFYIKLINYTGSESGTGDVDSAEQYLQTINVGVGEPDEWVDVEFIFLPMSNEFNALLFELQRTSYDFRYESRFPKIAYIELSEIKNIIPTVIGSNIKLIKLGVQTRPSLLMCINGEEIRTCKTGIYEIKNGLITVSFFSVANAAKETNTALSEYITITTNAINEINADFEQDHDYKRAEQRKEAIESECFLTQPKTREIDSFTLDYMYKED